MADLKGLIDQAVVAEIHGSDFPAAKGIAVYCPRKGKEKYMSDAYAPTRFAHATKWDELLAVHFAGKGLSPSLYPLSLAGHDGACVPKK